MKTVQQVRWEKNISVEQLSKLSGLSPATISNIENNRVSPTLVTLCALSDALHIEACDICICKKLH